MSDKPRRSKGEGTLEWLPKTKRWRIRITVDTPTGKTRKAFTHPTKKGVRAKRDAWLKDRHGLAFDAENLTVSGYLDRWMEDSVRQTRRPSTVAEYESVCRIHLKPALGTLKLIDLKAAHIQGLLSQKRREGYASGTARRIYAVFGAALSQAVKWQLLAHNPMQGVDAPKATRIRSRDALTLEQAKRLFSAANDWRGGRLYAPLLLSVSTGMRQGEMLGLFWGDLDVRRGTLSVKRTLHREKGGGIRYGPPKGGKERVLELDARVLSVLKEHRKAQLEDRMRSEDWSDTGHVFTTTEGLPLHRAVLYQSFKRLCKREGLPDITFHELRHTCATLLAERNVHPSTVQMVLGHADVATTLRQYTHAWKNQSRDASEGLADVIFDA
jgi:integrase